MVLDPKAPPVGKPPAGEPKNDPQSPPEPIAEVVKLQADVEEMRSGQRQVLESVGSLTNAVMALQQPKVEAPASIEVTEETLRDDPQGTLDAHFNTRVKPLLDAQAQHNIAVNKDAARVKYGETFTKYEKEIDAVASRMSPETLQKPGSYDEIFSHVQGQHLPDIVKDAVAAERAKWEQERDQVDAEGLPRGGAPIKTESGEELPPLDARQRAVARQMKVTDEEYAIMVRDHETAAAEDLDERLGVDAGGR
jgi:hypothetical protein